MKLQGFGLALALGLMSTVPAMAGLIGSPVNLSTAATGGVTITAWGSSGSANGSATVGSGVEFSFCVGPNGNYCDGSGLLGFIDLSDSAVSFNFGGSTLGATGAFILELSGFDTTITSVTLDSGSLATGSFVLTSSDADSMTFTGTALNGSGFNAIGGRVITFDVDTSSTPEPSTVLLSLIGVLGLGFGVRRFRSTACSR